jgi:CRP-like cAMP-binding protein
VLELLDRGQWFGGLPPPLRATILDNCVARRYRNGEWLIREGDAPRGLYAILNGRVRVLRRAGTDREVLVHVAGPGLWIGEYVTLSGLPAISSTVADTEVDALLLTPTAFERIVAAEPRHYRHFAALVFLRYRQLYSAFTDVLALPSEEWLLAKLTAIVDMQRVDDGISDATVIEASQEDLATMIGVTRPTLRTLLRRLEVRGLVEVRFRKIRLLA